MEELDVKRETMEMKLAQWSKIVESCSTSGLSAKQWLDENHIPRTQYYYWLRRVKKKALLEQRKKSFPFVEVTSLASASKPESELLFNESNDQDISMDASIILHLNGATLEIKENASPALLRMVLSEVRNAQ